MPAQEILISLQYKYIYILYFQLKKKKYILLRTQLGPEFHAINPQ